MDVMPQVVATGWASGVNAYATVLVLGLLQRAGVDSIPSALGRTEVLAIVAFLFVVEFVVDKIPYADSAWDVLSTAVRPAVGAALGILLTQEANGEYGTLAAALTGGGTAFLTHTVKAATRLIVNLSPEPFSNVVVSTTEDVAAVSMVATSLVAPWLAATIALLLLAIGLYVVIKGWRFVRRRFGSRRRTSTQTSP
jgi:hypothetical protein